MDAVALRFADNEEFYSLLQKPNKLITTALERKGKTQTLLMPLTPFPQLKMAVEC